ncbi:MAG: HD domain-containing protein [Bacillota bacterium]
MLEKEYRTVAALDIGSSGLRMIIADVFSDGRIQPLEQIKKNTSIGHDSFTMGRIGVDTIKKICLNLSNCQKLLEEYQVDEYIAVATSGMREAENRDYILSQIKSRTNLDIKIINNAEERYLTYKAIKYYIPSFSKRMKDEGLLIVDIGSGGVEISVYNDGMLKFTDYLKAGSLRLSKILADLESISLDFPRIMEEFIETKFHLLKSLLEKNEIKRFIGLGGELRTLLDLFKEENYNDSDIMSNDYDFIKKDYLRNLYSTVKHMTTEQIRENYGLDFQVAKTLLPSVIIFNYFLKITQTSKIIVPLVSIRHGLIADMLEKSFNVIHSTNYKKDIISSVKQIGNKYQILNDHSDQVEWLALTIFEQTKNIHKLGQKEELYLQVASILHDVGKFIDSNHHALHSYNILSTQDIMGFSDRDLNIMANIVKYHEEEDPQSFHENYRSISFEDRIVIAKLVAILKLANSLDISSKQKIKDINIIKNKKFLRFNVVTRGNFLLEKWLFMKRAHFFEEVFGYKPELIIEEDDFNG